MDCWKAWVFLWVYVLASQSVREELRQYIHSIGRRDTNNIPAPGSYTQLKGGIPLTM
jgi:hypothetical protein